MIKLNISKLFFEQTDCGNIQIRGDHFLWIVNSWKVH